MTCPVDGREIAPGAVICGTCAGGLGRALGDVGWLVTELDTTMTRQTKTRPARGNQSSDGPPMPYNIRAADALRDLRTLLKDWTSLVAEGLADQGVFVALPTPATPTTLAAWLRTQLDWVTRHDTAPDAYTEIVGAVNNIRRTIDIAPDTTYIGPCYATTGGSECQETLYAVTGHTSTTCKACGTTWDTNARTLEALAHAETIAQTQTVMTRSFALQGVNLDSDRLRKWVARGHLTPHGTGARGRPTYIVAHVARLVALHNAGQKLTPWPTQKETTP